MNANTNRNYMSSSNNKTKIPEGNWRTNNETQMKNIKELDNTSLKNNVPEEPTYPPPSFRQPQRNWSNNNKNKKHIVINTTPTPPIKIKDFVYDIDQFPPLNSTQIKPVYNEKNTILSYATIPLFQFNKKILLLLIMKLK